MKYGAVYRGHYLTNGVLGTESKKSRKLAEVRQSFQQQLDVVARSAAAGRMSGLTDICGLHFSAFVGYTKVNIDSSQPYYPV